jgi:hypothetical protein
LSEVGQIHCADLLTSHGMSEGQAVNHQRHVDGAVTRNAAIAIAIQFLAGPVTKLVVACLRTEGNALAKRRC